MANTFKKIKGVDLDKLKNENKAVYIKVNLIKRLTYGEYLGEPNDGYSVKSSKNDTELVLGLDNFEIFKEINESEGNN